MMKLAFAIILLLATALSAEAAPVLDLLATKSFEYRAEDPDAVLSSTTQNLRDVFQLYVPAFDSSTTITSPYKVSGSQGNPLINVSVKKCVMFMCPNVDLEGSVTIREVPGKCKVNYLLEADLGRSSPLLANAYNRLTATVCYESEGKNGRITIAASAQRAPGYSRGPVSNEIYKMLLLQVTPMSGALQKSLLARSANR